MPTSNVTGCVEHRKITQFSRRGALQAGVLGGLGLTLSDALRREAVAGSSTAKAKSVILLWLQGGVSHHDTFDMKPDAPADIRGEFSPIATNLPGVFIGEYMPRLARMMDRLAVVRSMTHSEGAHQRGAIYMVEGRRPSPATGVSFSGNPELGSMFAWQLGMRNGVPPFVSCPGNDFTSRFIGPGWLPPSCGSFKEFQASSLKVPAGFSEARFQQRMSLRGDVDSRSSERAGHSQSYENWDRFNEQALDIIASNRAAEAFDISDESDETKRAYGVIDSSGKPTRGQMGALCLKARRLVEAGVRFVTVGRNSWDHHSTIFPQLRSRVPRVDNAVAGLLADLEQRGMLDETLVILSTEFGRTPKVNSQAGRDHWPRAFSIALAGAGIKTGQVIGATDSQGGSVVDHPVSPEELAATVLHLAGINPRSIYVGNDGRPHMLVDQAKPVSTLLA